MQTNEAIQLWKEKNIERCEMEFSCGGDSMNETNFVLYDKDNKEVDCDELNDYFENEVYNRVDFYEVSDGHYMGEFGSVIITFEEDEDEDDGGYFSYDKQAQGEWEEMFSETMEVELSDVELKLLQEKIENVNGSEWDSEVNINFKDDCVLTDEEEEILNGLTKRIQDMANEFDIEGKGEENGDGRNFDTGSDGEGCEIEEGKLQVSVSARFYYTEESYD